MLFHAGVRPRHVSDLAELTISEPGPEISSGTIGILSHQRTAARGGEPSSVSI
jgi:hypothetical protein